MGRRGYAAALSLPPTWNQIAEVCNQRYLKDIGIEKILIACVVWGRIVVRKDVILL